MALITVQRSSSNSSAFNSDEPNDLSKSNNNVKSITESFFVVKGAALILQKNECRSSRYLPETVHDIKQHLHAIFGIVRPQDRLTLAIRVDTNGYCERDHIRYIALLSTVDRFDIEEYCLIGVDIIDCIVTVGLVMPIFSDLLMKLDGNGGLKLYSNDKQYTVRPVTVQALWSVFQALNKASKQSRIFNFFPGGISHTWIEIYRSDSIRSNDNLLNDWSLSDDIIAYRSDSPVHFLNESLSSSMSSSESDFLQTMTITLKDIMTRVDLDEVTSKYLRQRLEGELGHNLSEYGKFIDDTILRIFAHMDRSSKILDTLFLGSEWNASNYDELKERNVGYILNVSNEIDNFFPAEFKYMNIRVQDVEDAKLIREWDKTYKFILNATTQGKGCLVHCKMGISRSAATVIAFLMKKNDWTLDEALTYVRTKRNCVRPNAGFMDQLYVYEGILKASKVKRKLSEQSIKQVNECTNKPILHKSENFQCVLANGTEYLIKRFLESVHEYWSKREHKDIHRSSNMVGQSSSVQSHVPMLRFTKPDQSWIRYDTAQGICCRSSYSLADLKYDNSPYDVAMTVPKPNKSQLSGAVQRRVRALEVKSSNVVSTAYNDLLTRANKPNNSIKLSRIQRLIRLYSFGLDDSKIAREVSAVLQKKLLV